MPIDEDRSGGQGFVSRRSPTLMARLVNLSNILYVCSCVFLSRLDASTDQTLSTDSTNAGLIKSIKIPHFLPFSWESLGVLNDTC